MHFLQNAFAKILIFIGSIDDRRKGHAIHNKNESAYAIGHQAALCATFADKDRLRSEIVSGA
jgi:hypothetical protein